MPNLSIKNVPEALAEQLRQRAAANHRSLQGELMAILEATVQTRHPASTLTLHNATVSSETVQQRLQAIADHPVLDDGLLSKLDELVAGTNWGDAPILSRTEANRRGRE